MPCADAASRKYEWENSVPRFCQVKYRFVEPHIDEASNIFPKHPTGPQLGNNSAHLRPQVACILKAAPFSCGAERLARESAGDNGNCCLSCLFKKRLLCECRNIPEPGHVRPMLFQDGKRIVRPFALTGRFKARRLRRQVKTADAGKQAYMGEFIHPRSHPKGLPKRQPHIGLSPPYPPGYPETRRSRHAARFRPRSPFPCLRRIPPVPPVPFS